MNIGLLGTGAISHKHAQAYANIGWKVVACCDISPQAGEAFAAKYGCDYVPTLEGLVNHPKVQIVDVCTFPNVRLEPVELCAKAGKHVQVQKPIATRPEVSARMVEVAHAAGITLNVVSQHRFDDSVIFLRKALAAGRLGRILQADAYVKWFRSAEYYSRPIKGSWEVEGGGALINQAIHQIDVLLHLIGPVSSVYGTWQLGARHKIESEDVITAMLRYANGATGVIQASTAFWPGYSERVEIHGTKGTAIMTGDRLTAWDVENDEGEAAPVASNVASGASDPMAISLEPFERQFREFGAAIAEKREPLVSGTEGHRDLCLVAAIYESCRENRIVSIANV